VKHSEIEKAPSQPGRARDQIEGLWPKKDHGEAAREIRHFPNLLSIEPGPDSTALVLGQTQPKSILEGGPGELRKHPELVIAMTDEKVKIVGAKTTTSTQEQYGFEKG